jgi:hypothetical protein
LEGSHGEMTDKVCFFLLLGGASGD